MMQTEVAEVYEPFAHGRGSSSTMPQKRNPISSCYIHAAAGVVRQMTAALLDAMVADHERSTGPWEIEWIALPEAFMLTAGALKQSKFVLDGLEVDAQRMRANLDITNGLVVSEAVMMGLAPVSSAASTRTTSSTTSAARRSSRTGRCSICSRRTPRSPSTSNRARSSPSSATRPSTSASPA